MTLFVSHLWTEEARGWMLVMLVFI